MVAIDWDRFDADDAYLDGVSVAVDIREPERFTGDRTGTVMRVTGIRASWTPGQVLANGVPARRH